MPAADYLRGLQGARRRWPRERRPAGRIRGRPPHLRAGRVRRPGYLPPRQRGWIRASAARPCGSPSVPYSGWATSDHAVEQLGGRRPMRLQAELRNALRVSAYELLFSDAVPDRAAVSEGVELARQVAGGRVAGLANAVLRRIAEAGPAWVEGLPLPLRVLVSGVGDRRVDGAGRASRERPPVREAQNRAPELCVRLNPLRAQAQDERELGGRARGKRAAGGEGARRGRRPGRHRGVSARRRLAAVALLDGAGAAAGGRSRGWRARSVCGAGRQGGAAGGADGGSRPAGLRRAPPRACGRARAHASAVRRRAAPR